MEEKDIVSSNEVKKFFPYTKDYSVPLNYAKLGRLVLNDITKTKRSNSKIINYSKDDVLRYLESPDKFENQLRDISRKLYQLSPHYKRAINYFAKMPRLDYIIEPYGINTDKVKPETLKSQFLKVCDFLDLINIKHEFLKVLNIAFKEDVFYGYEHMTKESYFIQKLNPEYCRISSIEDGVYNFAFDFSFFDKFPEQLEMFSSEFVSKYRKYKKNKDLKLQELDSKRTICIKVNEETENVIPPFAGVFESIYDLSDYKKLRKATKQIGAYKLLTMKVPMKTKDEEVNGFLVDYDTMMEFHDRAAQSVPEEIGIITVPFDVEPVDFSKGVKDEDNVGDAERDVWTNFGISQLLFNTDKSSSIGLGYSIQTDEQLVFAVIRQIERWINRRLRFEFKSLKFRVNILNTTVFNWEKIYEVAKSGAEFGLPTKMMATSALGISPSSMLSLAFLENEVLELPDKLVPLASAHTATSEEGGAPSKGADITEDGLRTRDEEKNKRK
jgi:hypothetical protein